MEISQYRDSLYLRRLPLHWYNLLYLRAPGRYKVIDMYLMLVAFTLPHWWILDSNGLPTTTSIYLNHM